MFNILQTTFRLWLTYYKLRVGQRFPNNFFRDPVIFMFLFCDPLKFVSPLRAYWL